MIGQMSQLFEATSTFGALVWLLPRVRVAMDLHVNLLMKPFTTEVTDKWLDVSVCAHVRVQVGRSVERFVALWAHIRLGGGVGQTVTCEVTWLTEGAAACFALEWLITCQEKVCI